MAKAKQSAKRGADSATNTSSMAARKRSCPSAGQSSLTSKQGSQASRAILVEGTPEASKAPHRAFLWFANGSVLVALSENGTSECRLNKAVLERSSSWFAFQMSQPPKSTALAGSAAPSGYYFTLVVTPGESIPCLFKQVSNFWS